jgi:hypothetical protein
MKLATWFLELCAIAVSLSAQPATQPSPATPSPATPSASETTSAPTVLSDLDRLQAAASATSQAISRIRIEKWKADHSSKQQALANADSIQRNLTSALPGMIDGVRSAPQDLAMEFKLYRNINALYDVMSSLTESTGAFGAKSDYDALAKQVDVIDSVRRNLGDVVEGLASSTQSELGQLRVQLRAAQQAAAAAAAAVPPKRVLVDDNAPEKKAATGTKKKTPPKKPATTDSSAPAGTSQPKN